MNNYIIAMAKDATSRNHSLVTPLDTGKRYGKVAAQMRADDLNKTCQAELKALDYDRFVVYSVYSE